MTVIVAEYLPRLFLSDADYKELADLVLLDPRQLMSLMRVIMELNTKKSNRNLNKNQINELEKYGRADKDLLRVCWEEFLPSADPTTDIRIDHLILIFQAYCLIYPVQPAKSGGSGIKTQEYIIPSKLPAELSEEDKREINGRKKHYTKIFFFDFCQFLPDEIYYRLICLFSSEATPHECLPHCYSRSQCFFSGLSGTNWIIDMEEKAQRLKIMVP